MQSSTSSYRFSFKKWKEFLFFGGYHPHEKTRNESREDISRFEGHAPEAERLVLLARDWLQELH
jgi:hypothetical protein